MQKKPISQAWNLTCNVGLKSKGIETEPSSVALPLKWNTPKAKAKNNNNNNN